MNILIYHSISHWTQNWERQHVLIYIEKYMFSQLCGPMSQHHTMSCINFEVSIVHADGLAPLNAKSSGGIVVTLLIMVA